MEVEMDNEKNPDGHGQREEKDPCKRSFHAEHTPVTNPAMPQPERASYREAATLKKMPFEAALPYHIHDTGAKRFSPTTPMSHRLAARQASACELLGHAVVLAVIGYGLKSLPAGFEVALCTKEQGDRIEGVY